VNAHARRCGLGLGLCLCLGLGLGPVLAQDTPLGWTDAARTLRPEPEKLYSWWSYRAQDWSATNKGRRLDHIWLSDALKPTLRDLTFLREARGWERPSDHVPVTVTLDL